MNRFHFVSEHARRYGVKRLRQVIGLARSSYYHWPATTPEREAREAADLALAARIRAVNAESQGTYGAPRITAELRDEGMPVNHKRVARVMRKFGITGLRLRRRHATTVADQSTAKAPDLLQRDFTATEVNTGYVGEITYLRIGAPRFCYLATVMDLASRRLAGWAAADHMRVELVIDALKAAERTRGSLTGAIFHTDPGPNTQRKPSQTSATKPGRSSPWARSAPQPKTPPPNRSTPRSSARRSKAATALPTSARPASRCSGGPTATTPADATPVSDRSPHSPTRTP